MNESELSSLKKEIEALPPADRIARYSELLKKENLDKKTVDEILELIQKAAIEEELIFEEVPKPDSKISIEEPKLQETEEELEQIVEQAPRIIELEEETPDYVLFKEEDKTDNQYKNKKYEKRDALENIQEIHIHGVEELSEDLYKSKNKQIKNKNKIMPKADY